jgi:hypothetical protein
MADGSFWVNEEAVGTLGERGCIPARGIASGFPGRSGLPDQDGLCTFSLTYILDGPWPSTAS